MKGTVLSRTKRSPDANPFFITSSFRQIILNAQDFFSFESKANSSEQSHARHQNQIALSVLSRWSVSKMPLRNGPPTRLEWTVIHASDTTHSRQPRRTKHSKNNFPFRQGAAERSFNYVDQSVGIGGLGGKERKNAVPRYSRVPWNSEATLFLRQKALYFCTERAMTLRMRIPVSICWINRR